MRIYPVGNMHTSFSGVKFELCRTSPAMQNHLIDSIEKPEQLNIAKKWCSEILVKLEKFTNEQVIKEVVNKKSKTLGKVLNSDKVWPQETKVSIYTIHKNRNRDSSIFGINYDGIESNSVLDMDFYITGKSGKYYIGTADNILETVCSENGKKIGGMLGFVSQLGAVTGAIKSVYGLDEELKIKKNFTNFIEAELEKQPEFQEYLKK